MRDDGIGGRVMAGIILALAGLTILHYARACPAPPDPSAATIDSLVAVGDSLRARAESLDARPIVVDTVTLTRVRRVTDTLLVGPAGAVAMVAPAAPNDTLVCWPLPAFLRWRDDLRQQITTERDEANAVIDVWHRRAQTERALRGDYQRLADSALTVARQLQRANERLQRPRITLAPYVGVGIQSNGTAGLQVGVGFTYQRRRS